MNFTDLIGKKVISVSENGFEITFEGDILLMASGRETEMEVTTWAEERARRAPFERENAIMGAAWALHNAVPTPKDVHGVPMNWGGFYRLPDSAPLPQEDIDFMRERGR